MKFILTWIVPCCWWHWLISIVFWGGVSTFVAQAVDFLLYGAFVHGFVEHLLETSLTATPLVVFALLLVRHANDLRQEAMVLALQDPLTGLLNRRAFLLELEKQRDGTLFMIDLDHFKEVNDRYGHLVGDDVLCAAASAMTKAVRRNDFVGRLGGEEFAIFSPGLQGKVALALGETLTSGTQHTEPFSRDTVRVTASVGAYWTDQKTDSITLLRKADHALYQAKEAGRARIIWFSDDIDATRDSPSAVA